jgi:hypothetical protein
VSTADWDAWFAGLDTAATELEQQLADGALLSFPDLPPPPIRPDGPGLPPELLPRATRVLNRLERLERIARAQRDSVAAQLVQLRPPRPRPATVPSYELGRAIDIAG